MLDIGWGEVVVVLVVVALVAVLVLRARRG
jgi:hypothetical protein